jgi:serine/threonine-protein kinase
MGNISSGTVVPGPDSANVAFTSNPWAKVYVDGRMVGETPLAQPIFLGQGKHSITFSNPSFDPILKNINVRPGKDQVVSADFLEYAGFLLCAVQPWAEVYVDEQYKDTTPLNRPIILSAGFHSIRFHNNAFSDTMRAVTIKPRDTLKITVTLRSLR